MANNGPFYKVIENDKSQSLNQNCGKKWMYNGAFLKSLSIVLLHMRDYACVCTWVPKLSEYDHYVT